ncbi:MAG: hypothetical protein ACLSGF_10330 [Alistipes onderdonkii]
MIRGWLYLYKANRGRELPATGQSDFGIGPKHAGSTRSTGSLNDPGYFAFALVDAWFDLYDLEKGSIRVVQSIAGNPDLSTNRCATQTDRYPEYWNAPLTQPLAEYDLRMQSCVAYLYSACGRIYP